MVICEVPSAVLGISASALASYRSPMIARSIDDAQTRAGIE